MKLLLEGEEIDIFDEAALMSAIERRTESLIKIASGTPEERERALLNSFTYLALKVGALAAYHSARREDPISLDHLVEVAQQIQASVGLNFIQPEPIVAAAAPQLIVPNAALEGADDDSEEG